MFKFYGTTALEGRNIPVGSKAHGIPETHGSLHTQLVLESSQGDLAGSKVGSLELHVRSQVCVSSRAKRCKTGWNVLTAVAHYRK